VKKNVALAFVITAVSMSVQAQSNSVKTAGNWEFYGRAHMSVDKLDDGNLYDRINLSSNSSRLGFRGDKQFGDLKGIWQIESEIRFNQTASDASSKSTTTGAPEVKAEFNTLSTRDTFAGIEGSFGQFKVGKFDTPMKVARGAADLFGDQLGDMRNITSTGAKFDLRPNNIIQYQTPTMGGLRFAVALVPHSGAVAETNSTTGVETKNGLTSMSLSYDHGDLAAAVAHESTQKDTTDGDREATRLALSYKVMKDLKLVGFYQEAKYMKAANDDQGSKVTGFGAEYQIVPNHTVLRAHVMDRAANKANSDAKLTAIGIDRIIDKQLRFYANYATVSNGTAVNVASWNEGRSASMTLPDSSKGKKNTGISVGMRYDF
jgi:predicted porin